MISVFAATWLVRIVGLYLGLGLVFAVGFAFRWVNRTDAVAAHGTAGFRLLLLPGATLLWPLLLRRLLRGDRHPPVECTAHRATRL
jgi:hypothetical protein